MHKQISVSLPLEIMNKVDKLIGQHGFYSRPDVICDALRDFFEKYPETKIIPTTTVVEAVA